MREILREYMNNNAINFDTEHVYIVKKIVNILQDYGYLIDKDAIINFSENRVMNNKNTSLKSRIQPNSSSAMFIDVVTNKYAKSIVSRSSIYSSREATDSVEYIHIKITFEMNKALNEYTRVYNSKVFIHRVDTLKRENNTINIMLIDIFKDLIYQ